MSTSTVVWKACQRRLYSWLSSKCGLPVCVVGVLLALISALQFGEVFLQWSREKYAVQFSIYADNIAGRSYEIQLCPPLPIDIVYTWVNGSDPDLIREIRTLRKRLAKKSNASHSLTNATNSSAHPPSDLSCPFNNCVPWRMLVIDASNLTTPLTMETLGINFPSLQRGTLSCTHLNATKTHQSPVYMVRLTTEEQVTSILRSGLVDRHGTRVRVARGYLTSDGQLAGVVRMEGFYLALSNGIHPLNSSKLFRKWMESHYGRHIREVEVKANRTAVVSYKPDTSESVPETIPYRFSGETVTLHQGFLIWLPFTLPHSKDADLERPDVVSASRFQDNEELRYSLRSIERFAPWVRHVFIVTNGQIPSWLNLDYPRVTLVPHKDIFPNHTHLPTYSSPAIESHLHRIPGLADHFIYLNDDVMFGDHVWPEDFYTHQRGQKVYLSWPVPNCAEGCPPSWIRDKYCDANCNNSACDWDGGDCVNVTRPGPQGAHAGYSQAGSSDHCGPGCLDSWLGDRYCDSACRTPECGYDAGDCGTEKWEELLGYMVRPSGGNFSLPLETAALYFNLSEVFHNGSISGASHTPSKLIRTAIVARKYNALALTLARNVSITSANFSISGKVHNQSLTVNFTLWGDTASKNKSKVLRGEAHQLLAVDRNDTSSREFLQAVVAKISSQNKSINYWIPTRTKGELTSAPPTLISSYMVSNLSLLPAELGKSLQRLEEELQAGDWTRKGYLKERASLLQGLPSHLVRPNGSISFGSNEGVRGPGGGGGVRGHKDHMELNREEGVGLRKLLHLRKQQLPELVLGWEESRRRSPWERLHLFPDTNNAEEGDQYEVRGHHRSRKLAEEMTDTFADSLRHVNRLYTKVYGHSARKVPSHMPHYIQRQVMTALQDKFPHHFQVTSSHSVRMADDMQFAFSYFYFLMSEKVTFDVEEMFAELDTDETGILSVRELRTLLAMTTTLPITMDDVHGLEDMLKSCDQNYTLPRPQVSPREYETLYDPKLPLVTLEFTERCKPLVKKLNGTVTTRQRYKFEEASSDVISFKMINENASEVIMMLDEIRKEKKKFICLNDNIDHSKEGAELSKLILVDFYESLFPKASQFEIPGQYRNRFLHLDELREWLEFKERMHQLLYAGFLITLLLSLASLFYGKLAQWKRKFTQTLSSIFLSRRTESSI